MTKPANGEASSISLVTVQTGTYAGLAYAIKLETATAAAYEKAKAAGGLSIAAPLGGYRSLDGQAKLKAKPGDYGSTLSSSQIAPAGNSTHGYGDCVDILANNAWFQIHCGTYGFVRESPAGENNHYRYLHPTWAPAPPPMPVPTATQRQARNAAVNARRAPSTSAAIDTAHNIPANGIAGFESPGGYVHGEKVTANGVTSDVWFVSHQLEYFSATAFLTQSTANLKLYVPPAVTPPPVKTPPVVTTPPTTTPTEPTTPVVTTPPVTTPTDPVVPSAPAAPTDPSTGATDLPPTSTPSGTTTPAASSTTVTSPTTEPPAPPTSGLAAFFQMLAALLAGLFGGKK